MILIIHGPPAVGKTTLATKVGAKLQLPHIGRDYITEWLMDAGHIDHQDFHKYIGHAGYELMFNMTSELVKGKSSFMVEGCLNPQGAASRFQEVLGPSIDQVVEVFLSAPIEVLVERYRERTFGENRHKAHNDTEKVNRIKDHLESVKYTPMNIGSELIEVDGLEDPQAIFLEVVKKLKSHL
jgi:adenylate kinase family enzyme